MRRSSALLLCLALAACGEARDDASRTSSEPRAPSMMDAAETVSAPGISPTAAPGVAFNYRYTFRLPAQRIAAVQEQHAQACEKLGINRCRITGMRYRLVNQTDIEGMLAFKLDPAIARAFGKAGVDSVAKADGMLVDSEITGEDAGAAIGAANRNEAQYRDDLTRIEAQLGRPGLAAAERDRLRAEAERRREALRAVRDNREVQEESLAKTPMVFHYGSGDLIPGFDTRSPIRHAFERAGNNFIDGVTILFIIVVTLLPWALLAGFAWWLFLRISARMRRRDAIRAPAEEASESG